MKRLLLLALTLSVFAIPALCQCEDEGDTLNWTDGFVREDGNTLYYSAYAYVTGGEDEWYEYVSATGLNSNSDEEFSPAVAEVYWTNTLQLIGPGTYSEIAEFEFEDDDDEEHATMILRTTRNRLSSSARRYQDSVAATRFGTSARALQIPNLRCRQAAEAVRTRSPPPLRLCRTAPNAHRRQHGISRSRTHKLNCQGAQLRPRDSTTTISKGTQ